MQIDQTELHPLGSVLIVEDTITPLLPTTEEDILISLEAVFEQVDLVFLIRHFDQFIFLSLKLLPDWDLLFKFLASCLKLVIDVRVSDSIEDSL